MSAKSNLTDRIVQNDSAVVDATMLLDTAATAQSFVPHIDCEAAHEHLPPCKVVDKSIEEKKAALADAGVSPETKLAYAMQLADAGITEFQTTDENGNAKQIKIEAPVSGEPGAIRIMDNSSDSPTAMVTGKVQADDTLSVDTQYLQQPPAWLNEAQRYEWNARRIEALDTLGRLRAKQRERAYYAQKDARSQNGESWGRGFSRSRNGSTGGGIGGGGASGSGRSSGSAYGGFDSFNGGATFPAVPAFRLDMPQAGNGPNGEVLPNGMISFSNLNGCRVDTDGSGAWRHPEDPYRQSQTSLTVNGRSLDTDKDCFVALPPSVRERYGIEVGDKGFLIRQDTQQAVPVVFGDVSPEKHWRRGEPEASCAALRALGFNDVSGINGVDESVKFQLVMEPDSKSKSSDEMLASLSQSKNSRGDVADS